MQVLLTGSERGQLAWELKRTKPDDVILHMPVPRLDITDESAVKEWVEKYKPDVIINAAAYTAVDQAEVDPELAFAVNDTAVGYLATAAKAANAHLIHVSTDFVFGDCEAVPIKTDAPVDPISVYGRSKLAGERKLQSILPDQSLLVRTAWVYSSHGNNFVKTMLRLMKERGEVGVIADQIGTPTWANSLARAIWRGARIRATGTLHWTDAGSASWHDFAQAIMEEGVSMGLLDKPVPVNPLRTDQYPTPAARPSYSVLELASTWDALDMQAEHWREELRNMMRELSMRNMLVTGAAGFIGANFVRYCREQHPEDNIVIVDSLTYAGNTHNLDGVLDDKCKFVEADINDTNYMMQLLRLHKINTIVHFAAESHVDRSITGPDAFIEANIMGTYSLLKAARQVWQIEEHAVNDHRFHHVSTDEVYGTLSMDDPAFTEETAYAPNSPYSASKASSDFLVRSYHHTYGMQVTTSNCSNNYGPYHFPEKLIPLVILNVLDGQSLPIYGDGKNIRDWLYVEDHALGIDLVLQNGRVGETYNIGGCNEWTNIDIVNLICSLMDKRFESSQLLRESYPKCPASQGEACNSLITYVNDRAGHDFRYAIDTQKIQSELGYEPKVTFETGIEKTLDWYLENNEWWEAVLDGSYRVEEVPPVKKAA